MAYVIAVLMASLSFLLNRAAIRYIGIQAVISLGPVLEEGAKTLLAFYLGADILVTHIVFGLIEAVYDWIMSDQRGPAAACLSIVGHSLFGIVTVAILWFSGDNLVLALAGASVAHLTWNVTMIRLAS